jgi:hypothetical protein
MIGKKMEFKAQMIERTEGNPFFLEESVRTLGETKVLESERGVYRLAKPVESIQVPATVQAVLAARIDRLPAEEKRLLQSAAVIGEDIPFTLLSAIAELPEGCVAAWFSFRRRNFLQSNYFRISNTLSSMVLPVKSPTSLQDRRRSMHAAVVEGIERLYAGRLTEQVEQLAYHALRGEVWIKQ